MPRPIKFESPVVQTYPTDRTGNLTLTDCSATTKWLIRASSDGPAANRLRVPFGSSRQHPTGVLVLGLRPGEWVLLGLETAILEVVDGLQPATSSEFVTGVDWTHGQALFRVTGTDARRVLQKLCSLEWSDLMTPDGAVVSGSVARVSCDIARNDQRGVPAYLLLCDRSFGQYLFDVLVDAGAEFGLLVTPDIRRNHDGSGGY